MVFLLKVAFFDRDGTIIEDYPDQKWSSINAPVFLPNAIKTLKEVLERGYEIIIVTNQYLINEEYISLEQYQRITEEMVSKLKKHGVKILDIFYCPHSRGEGCKCMKPQTGMLVNALKIYPNIELAQSFMIGDTFVDIELAINFNIKGFGIGVGSSYNTNKITELREISELVKFI